MAQQPLYRKGMPQHLWRHAHGVMDRAMRCDEWLVPHGKREHTALGWAALQMAFAIPHETMAMPVTMLLCEASL